MATLDRALNPDGDSTQTEWWSDEDAILARVGKARTESAAIQADWMEEASENYRFVANDQWTDEEKAAFEEEERAAPVFNRIARVVQSICGQQVANRQETHYLPTEVNDAGGAEFATQIAKWVRTGCDAEDEESDVFRDMVITGMGWSRWGTEYDEDPAGKLIKDRIDPRRMRWDPSSRKKNLGDARWIQCDWFYSLEGIKERWPKAMDKLALTPDAGRTSTEKQPHDATNDWRYRKNATGIDRHGDQYRVIHHVEWRREMMNQLVDPGSGQVISLTDEQIDTLEERLGSRPPAARTPKRIYHYAYTCGRTVLEMGEAPLQHGCEYQCMTGIRDEEDGTWIGAVEALKDPQKFANKIFASVMHSLSTNAKGGVVVEEGVAENKRKFEQDWAKPNKVVWVNRGTAERIVPKVPPVLPAQLSELMTFCIGSLDQISGVNLEFLGQAAREQPGIVESLRTQAGLIILTPLFDAFRLYMKRDGRVLAEMMVKFINDGRMVRIDPAGEQFAQLLLQPDTWRYDISVDESSHSRDVRERTFVTMMTLAPALKEFGTPPPIEAIDYAPLPTALREKWKAQIQQQMAQPPKPNPEEKLEQMKADNALRLEQQRAVNKNAELQMQLEQQRALELAQAQSQAAIESAKLEAKERGMAIDARLSVFETILKSLAEIITEREKMQMQMVQEQQMRAAELAMQPPQEETPDPMATLLPVLASIMNQNREGMSQIIDVLGGDIETERVDGKLRARRVPRSKSTSLQ